MQFVGDSAKGRQREGSPVETGHHVGRLVANTIAARCIDVGNELGVVAVDFVWADAHYRALGNRRSVLVATVFPLGSSRAGIILTVFYVELCDVFREFSAQDDIVPSLVEMRKCC